MCDLQTEIHLRLAALLETFPDVHFTISATNSNGDATIAETPALQAEVLKALTSATHALRSYEFGNGSPVLAASVADLCNGVLAKLKSTGAMEKRT